MLDRESCSVPQASTQSQLGIVGRSFASVPVSLWKFCASARTNLLISRARKSDKKRHFGDLLKHYYEQKDERLSSARLLVSSTTHTPKAFHNSAQGNTLGNVAT